MSHFVGIAFIPRDDDYTVNENYSKKEQTLENMFSMGSALDSAYLENLLAPYNEADDDYCTIEPELNELATDIYNAYLNKDKDTVDSLVNGQIDRMKEWKQKTKIWDTETNQSRTYTLAEVDKELEPIMMLSRLLNLDMTTEQFDMNIQEHKDLFEKVFINTSEWSINSDNQIFDHYFYNDEGYWDWYEVGGRWDNFFDQDDCVNVLEDISLLKGTRMVKRIHTLDWYLTIDIKEEEIKERKLDNRIAKSFKLDEFGKRIEETYINDSGQERTRYVVDEYWTTEELLDEEVEVSKYNFGVIITEENGWEQESRMGWFGISEKDTMEQDDKEFTEKSWEEIVNLRVDELLEDVDDNGVCKWVAVAVDFHI